MLFYNSEGEYFADKIRFEFYINREECSNISHSHNSKKEVESQHKSHTSWAVSYSIEKNIGRKSFLCDRESKLKFVPPSLSVQGQYLPKWEKDKSSNRHVNFSNLDIWSMVSYVFSQNANVLALNIAPRLVRWLCPAASVALASCDIFAIYFLAGGKL